MYNDTGRKDDGDDDDDEERFTGVFVTSWAYIMYTYIESCLEVLL